MTNLPRWLIVLLVVLLVLAGRNWLNRPVVQPHGQRLAMEPRQGGLVAPQTLQLGDFSLDFQASFDIAARVLSSERYRLGPTAGLAPLDLALGWGVMSDQATVEQLEVSQGGRWYILRWDLKPPAPERVLMQSSGNMHIIPADDSVRKQAFDLREGEFVRMKGYLVNAEGPGGFRWTSSLSRDDTGDGACELFLVQSIEVLQAPAG
jgi:hypothetical protein